MPSGGVTPAGAAFNGGTIHSELIIDTGASAGQAVELQGTRTSGEDVFRIDYPNTVLDIDSLGGLSFTSAQSASAGIRGTGTASASFVVADANANRVVTTITSTNGLSLIQSGTGNADVTIIDKDGNEVFAAGTAVGGGIVTSPQLSGALPTTTFASGTGKQVDTNQDRNLTVPVTFNPTAGAAATCALALSPDGVTYSTLGTETEPAGIAFDGTIHLLRAYVPAGWFVKLTVVNATIGTATYY